ncbi:MAG: 16S rRNA (guanine(966)-N(2))-methyltransferase RsmD [Rubrimonas sp.]
MRIVGGRLGGRPIAGPGAAGGGAAHLRPTSDRVREAIFNHLAHGGYCAPPPPQGMRVLDLFAGVGALGLEALSRGATHCLFVDDHGPSRALIRENVERLGLIGEARIYRRDATRMGPRHGAAYDMAFLDPPYRSGLGPRALAGLIAGGWLAPDALAVLEVHADEPVEGLEAWTVEDDRVHGETRVMVLRRAG